MRLPQPQLESIGFLFETPTELVQAMGEQCLPEEADEIHRLFDIGLPPVTSPEALSVIFGYNPGFIWSLLGKTHRYYRYFTIAKGAGVRHIQAPRVALKAIQKWLGYHIQTVWTPAENVFGFVSGKSHIGAAAQHLSANWVYSLDIENFFPSVSSQRVENALQAVGYKTEPSISLLTKLCCLNGHMVQGAPSSPVLSNIALEKVDGYLASIALEHHSVYTRYADDIVFSGKDDVPDSLPDKVKNILIEDGWILSARKERLSVSPSRLKVHGLLVHGEKLRLTKGYRNQIRAYQHLLDNGKITVNDLDRIRGHLNYASHLAEPD